MGQIIALMACAALSLHRDGARRAAEVSGSGGIGFGLGMMR